jgi:hypothetical protein
VQLLILGALASLLGFLESRAVDAPLVAHVGAGVLFGVVWVSVAALVARRLRHSPRRTAAVAMAVALASAMLLAPGVILHLMYHAPASYLAVQQSDAGSGTVAYYAILNPLTEWLLVPLALHLAWPDRATRVPALLAAGLYYAERVTTYLYFAPAILAWPGRPVTPRLLDEVAVWLHLDVARMVVNGVAILLFTTVALRTVSERSPLPAAPVPA